MESIEYSKSKRIYEFIQREIIEVLLLTDNMENFRDISLKTYKIDLAWYYTIPGFAWDCMLRMTNVKLEILTDYDMTLSVENGLREGLSQ